MKVLVADKLEKDGLKLLQKEKGLKVDLNPGLSPEELKKIIGAVKTWADSVSRSSLMMVFFKLVRQFEPLLYMDLLNKIIPKVAAKES